MRPEMKELWQEYKFPSKSNDIKELDRGIQLYRILTKAEEVIVLLLENSMTESEVDAFSVNEQAKPAAAFGHAPTLTFDIYLHCSFQN